LPTRKEDWEEFKKGWVSWKPSLNSLFKADTSVRSLTESGIFGLVHVLSREVSNIWPILKDQLRIKGYSLKTLLDNTALPVLVYQSGDTALNECAHISKDDLNSCGTSL
jgi:hypothetical protein